jgi:AcrR family transcriptional regulator
VGSGPIAPAAIAATRRAGVARPTVYRYIRDRDALVAAVIQRRALRFVDRAAQYMGQLDLEGRSVMITVCDVRLVAAVGARTSCGRWRSR